MRRCDRCAAICEQIPRTNAHFFAKWRKDDRLPAESCCIFVSINFFQEKSYPIN